MKSRMRENRTYGSVRGAVTFALAALWKPSTRHPEVSEYLDQIFPFLGIRFVSLGDNYDSDLYKGQTAPMDVAFSSLLHDLYCKEISLKIRQSKNLKAQSGKYVCSVAPFGYIKAPTDKNKLIINAETADVVRRIFKMIHEGFTPVKIAAVFNAEKIISPTAMPRWNRKKPAGYSSLIGDTGVWSSNIILKIIRDERYTGNLVFGKTRVIDYRTRKRKAVPENDWIRASGTHEAIIGQEEFIKANRLCNPEYISKPKGSESPTLLSGKVKCGFCGKALNRAYKKSAYYHCLGSRLNYGVGCFGGKIYSNDLESLVLAVTKNEACKIVDAAERKRVAQRKSRTEKENILDEHKKFLSQLKSLERRGFGLYEDYASSKICKNDYLAAKANNTDEISILQNKIEELDTRLTVLDVDQEDIQYDGPYLQHILNTDTLTEELASLVDKVIVYDEERIEIRFSFGDALTHTISKSL